MQHSSALPSEARAPRFKLERKRSRDRRDAVWRQSTLAGHRGGTMVTSGGSPTASPGGGGGRTSNSNDDEPFPIFEALSSAIVSLSESAGNNAASRKPSLPAMPALRATLGSLLPSSSLHDEYLSPREAKRRRRNRILLITLKGMLFTAVAVQVIRTDRNYSAALNGTASSAKSSSSTTSATSTGEAGVRSPTMRQTAHQGSRLSSDTISHIIQGTSLENDPRGWPIPSRL